MSTNARKRTDIVIAFCFRASLDQRGLMNVKTLISIGAVAGMLCGCVSTERNYKAAGFESAKEARGYLPSYLYLSRQLTAAEWDAFYQRFPEYWKAMQGAKELGVTTDFYDWYSAYAFRWTTLARRPSWTAPDLERLSRKQVSQGDDVFQIVYALGPPVRVIWNNDVEALIFAQDHAVLLKEHRADRVTVCRNCAKKFSADRTTLLTFRMSDRSALQRILQDNTDNDP
jgi:hypothetical protein